MPQVKIEEKPIAIYFLESIRDGELLTGTELPNDLSENDPERTIGVYKIYGQTDLELSLRDIEKRTQANQDRPVIFLEAHGETDYLNLVSGEKLLWAQLDELLVNINAASRMELIAIASTCYGRHLSKCIKFPGIAPVLSAIGPYGIIRPGTLLRFNREFIGRLLEGGTIQNSLDIANRLIYNPDEHGNDKNPVKEVDANSYATMAIDRYISFLVCQPTNKALGIADLHTSLKQTVPSGTIITIDQITIDLRLIAPALIMQLWGSFLMLDRFPANAWRFPLPRTIRIL